MKPVNLKEVPLAESFNCLVVPGPTETFSDYELFEIDQFLMRGKSLAILLDRFHEVAPPGQQGAPAQAPRIVPLDTGLEKLLSHYGIQIRKSYVMDENCFKQRLPAQFGGGERPIYFAPLIKNELINHDPGFMKHIKALVVLKVSPLGIDSKRIQDLGLKVIGSGHGCLGCSEPDFWDNGPFYERLTNFPQIGIEATADKVGAVAATIVGVGIAAHAGLTALRQARVRPNSPSRETEKSV